MIRSGWARRDGQRGGVTPAGSSDYLHLQRREWRSFRHIADNAGACPTRHRGANPADQHRAITAKVTSKNFEEPASWQSTLGQTSDNAGAGYCAVEIKGQIGINISVQIVPVMPRFAGGVVTEVERFTMRRAAIGAPPILVVDHWLDREKMPTARGKGG